jgi:hypothetical protein
MLSVRFFTFEIAAEVVRLMGLHERYFYQHARRFAEDAYSDWLKNPNSFDPPELLEIFQQRRDHDIGTESDADFFQWD